MCFRSYLSRFGQFVANCFHCQRYVPKLSARRNFTEEVSERGRVSQERKHIPRWISLNFSIRCVSGLTFYEIPSVRIVKLNFLQVAPARSYAREELWTSTVGSFFRRQQGSERGDGYLASCEFQASSSSGRSITGVTTATRSPHLFKRSRHWVRSSEGCKLESSHFKLRETIFADFTSIVFDNI